MAKKYNVVLEVLSSMTRAEGTLVKEDAKVERMLISGVAADTNVARISVVGIQDVPGMAFTLFNLLSQKNINVDIILQSVAARGPRILRLPSQGIRWTIRWRSSGKTPDS